MTKIDPTGMPDEMVKNFYTFKNDMAFKWNPETKEYDSTNITTEEYFANALGITVEEFRKRYYDLYEPIEQDFEI